MKHILLYIILSFSVLGVFAQSEEVFIRNCVDRIGKDATYLKDFTVELGESTADGKPQVAKYSLVLSKNTQYRFSVCSDPSKQGMGVIELYDTNKKLGSSFDSSTGKDYTSFDFKCQKTGVYHIFIYFQDGKEGYAVGILSFVRRL